MQGWLTQDRAAVIDVREPYEHEAGHIAGPRHVELAQLSAQAHYFVHRGTLEMGFGDGTVQRLEEGSFARVDAPTMRKLRNVGAGDAVYVCVGGKDGYVGRDGRAPEGDPGPRATRIDGSGGN